MKEERNRWSAGQSLIDWSEGYLLHKYERTRVRSERRATYVDAGATVARKYAFDGMTEVVLPYCIGLGFARAPNAL